MASEASTSISSTADNPWHCGNRVWLCVSDGTTSGDWRFEIGEEDDLRLTIHEVSPQGVRTGQIILVAGRAMLTLGLELPEGQESDAVDGPVLLLQLVLTLLHRALPEGPEALEGEARVELGDSGEALQVGTLSASAEFPAPWSATGQVHGQTGTAIELDLHFTCGMGAQAQTTLTMRGTWERLTPPPALDDDMAVAGWRMYALGPRYQGDVLDHGAGPLDPAPTIGTLRARLTQAT